MKSIYGCESLCGDDALPDYAEDDLLLILLNSYTEMVDNFHIMIDVVIAMTLTGVAPFVAEMKVEVKIPLLLRVRITWFQQNPGVTFDIVNKRHLNDIKDLYLQFREDWRKDPLFKKPAVQCAK